MKITELQIFDWVKIPDTKAPYRRILAIEDPYNNSVYVDDYGSPDDDDNYSICYIEPIPLTPEILEKNGFEFNAVYRVYELHHFGQHIEADYENDIVCGLSVNITDKEAINTSEVNITRDRGIYVHELQHALRLCGLEELADNFKI